MAINTMDFDAIFTAYYSLFRADSDVPTTGDDEYTVGMRLANEAINYWANYEGVYWNQLWTTNQESLNVGQVTVIGQKGYDLPANFREAGSYIVLKDGDGVIKSLVPRIEPNQVQFQGTDSAYAYVADGKMNLNPLPTADTADLTIDFDYYKQPTEFTVGASTTEMANPYFIVHRMLAQQFRAARNPYYSSALRDSENTIRLMQLDNNSGAWDNPPTLADNSGSTFGASFGG